MTNHPGNSEKMATGHVRAKLSFVNKLLGSESVGRISRHTLEKHRSLFTRGVISVELSLSTIEVRETAGKFVWSRTRLDRRRCAEATEILRVDHQRIGQKRLEDGIAIAFGVMHLE